MSALVPLHARTYQVDAFRRSPVEVLLRGSVMDRKPPGMYIEEDPEPLVIHHMVVELTISYPQLVIIESDVTFNTFPQTVCPVIAERYGELRGLSISRGFTHQVRERFGGPRGCSHTTALLQAMAPVAVQCQWSMLMVARGEAQRAGTEATEPAGAGGLGKGARLSLNSCHVWDEHGDFYQAVTEGTQATSPMVPVRQRLEELGLNADQWVKEHPGA